MVNSNKFLDTVKDYFSFLVTEFEYRLLEEKIRGNAFYDIQYTDDIRIISISYENIEDYLLVTVFLLQDGGLPNYDDKSKTLHLNKLIATVIPVTSKNEIDQNNAFFEHFSYSSVDDLERKLLKSARELRLCLLKLHEN